ncbi:MAG: tetratricopeptide repeat protein [Methanobacterium sp.]|nr:MAG: tetratricopeptide repeat protein [Methanobacterium sp.]
MIGLFDGFKKNSLIKRSYELFNQGKYQEALECYDEILKTDQRYTDALYGKGKVLRELSRCQEALDIFDKILEIDERLVNPRIQKCSLL